MSNLHACTALTNAPVLPPYYNSEKNLKLIFTQSRKQILWSTLRFFLLPPPPELDHISIRPQKVVIDQCDLLCWVERNVRDILTGNQSVTQWGSSIAGWGFLHGAWQSCSTRCCSRSSSGYTANSTPTNAVPPAGWLSSHLERRLKWTVEGGRLSSGARNCFNKGTETITVKLWPVYT